jgi:hypothetical protein
VLIHAGDFTLLGLPKKVAEFNSFLKALPHQHKLVIAGNHDIPFDEANFSKLGPVFGLPCDIDPKAVKALLTDCTYLEDESVTIEGTSYDPVA